MEKKKRDEIELTWKTAFKIGFATAVTQIAIAFLLMILIIRIYG
jgi:hypothetical protein